MFATAYRVVVDQGLMAPGADLFDRRQGFLAELRAILRDTDTIKLMSRAQFSERERKRRSS